EARIAEDAAVTERARAELAAPLVQRDDLRRAEKVDDACAQIVGRLDDEVVGASKRRFDVRGARLGAEEVVLPAKPALLAAERGQAVHGAAERRAGVARRRRNENPLERRGA